MQLCKPRDIQVFFFVYTAVKSCRSEAQIEEKIKLKHTNMTVRERDTTATCACKIIYFIMTIHFSGSIQSTSLFCFSDAFDVALFFVVVVFSPKDKEGETETVHIADEGEAGEKREDDKMRSQNN